MIYSLNTVNPEECNQCILKQKYVSGSNSKCFKHMFEERQKEIFPREMAFHEKIIGDLKNIQSLLPAFLTQLSLCSSLKKTSLKIQQILEETEKIKTSLITAIDLQTQSKQTLGNLSICQPFQDIGKMSRIPNLRTFDHQEEQIEAFQIQSDFMNQNIKDWVGYFAEKLMMPNKKKIFIEEMSLPFESDPEMKIFKGQIHQKYENFLKKIQQKDRLLTEAINKLAEYVDLNERKGKRSNSVFDFSSKLKGRMTSSVTSMKGLNLSRTQSGRQTSKNKPKAKEVNSLKINTSSFVIDNVSGIFTSLEVPSQKLEETYLLLSCQAQCIEDLLQKFEEQSFLL